MICLFDLGGCFWSNWFASLSGADSYELTLTAIVECFERYSTLAVCCDSRSKRYDWYPEYKATRQEKPQEAIDALRRVEDACRDLGFNVLKFDGYEADDVMATLATQAVAQGMRADMITGDKDLAQCIAPGVRMIAKGEEVNCVAKYGVNPDQIRDWLALVGDAADNIPGCPGVGPGKAAALLAEFGTLEAARAATDAQLANLKTNNRRVIGDKLIETFRAWEPELAVKLVTVLTDAPVSIADLKSKAGTQAKPKQEIQPTTTTTTTPRKNIMTINIEKGFKKDPLLLVIYGQEGVGKSSLAAGAPSPFFADVEHKAAVLGVDRAQVNTWQDFLDVIEYMLSGKHEHKTLVVDTADALEGMLHRHLCSLHSWVSITAPGFGKGEVMAREAWTSMLDSLDKLRFEHGIHVIILAHSQVRTFANPEGNDYDRYEMKLDKKAAALFRERSTACLFAHYDVAVKTDKEKTVGLSTGERILSTQHTAAWDAKNTYNLPEVITLGEPPKGWAALSAHIRKFYESKGPAKTTNDSAASAAA